MRFKFAVLGCLALGAVSAVSWQAWASHLHQQQAEVVTELAGMHFPVYDPQKVIYHVTEGGGLFDRSYFKTLGSVRNHLDAVDQSNIDLRIVLQGNGIGMLEDASSNAELAGQIDRLRARGVRFVVCRNSLVGAGVSPRQLHGR